MKHQSFDYAPLRRSHAGQETEVADFQPSGAFGADRAKDTGNGSRPGSSAVGLLKETPTLRRGHLFSYLGLFLFTTVVYFRPYELIPALHGATSMAFGAAVFTLLAFVPTQLATEGTLTTRPREVNLILLLGLAALLSIPFGDDPSRSWDAFSDYLKVIVMFIVMVNVVRTKWRLQGLFLLALAVSCYLSVNAFSDYQAGIFKSDGYRVVGVIGNMFSNPNDLALHLVTISPIAVGFISRHAQCFHEAGLCRVHGFDGGGGYPYLFARRISRTNLRCCVSRVEVGASQTLPDLCSNRIGHNLIHQLCPLAATVTASPKSLVVTGQPWRVHILLLTQLR